MCKSFNIINVIIEIDNSVGEKINLIISEKQNRMMMFGQLIFKKVFMYFSFRD